MTKSLNLFLCALCALVILAGCAASEGTPDGDTGTTDGDESVNPDGDVPPVEDGDVTFEDGDDADGDGVDGDDADGDEELATGCVEEPTLCTARQYCDLESDQCAGFTCSYCKSAGDCGAGETCENIGGGNKICLASCNETKPCSGGFKCMAGVCALDTGKQCQPCTTCGGNPPGGPCAFESIWPGEECDTGGICLAFQTPIQPNNTCETNADCQSGWGPNGFCDLTVGGYCTASLCAVSCRLDGTCPDGPNGSQLCPETIQGQCLCSSDEYFSCVGDQLPGEPCNYAGDQGLYDGLYCQEDAMCLYFSGTPTCTSDAECQDWLPTSKCGDNCHCVASFCAGTCNNDGTCPNLPDGSPMYSFVLSGTCLCAPEPFGSPVGDQEAGDPCNYEGDEGEYDNLFCQEDATCLFWNSYPACASDAECEAWQPGSTCSNSGKCVHSFCAASCRNDGTCAPLNDGTPTYNVGIPGSCYCAPEPYAMPGGDQEAGETCDYEGDGGFFDGQLCVEGGACMSFTAYPNCTTDAECEAEFAPGAKCDTNAGKCAYSFCVEACNANDQCEPTSDGTPTYKMAGQSSCLCAPLPWGTPTGNQKPGQPCDYEGDAGFYNDLYCQDGGACLFFQDYPTCAADADCVTAFADGAKCDTNAGKCVASFCAGPCNACGDCDPLRDGTPTYNVGIAGQCLCAPAPYGAP